MHFEISPKGTDYTRVQIDAPNNQLAQIIHAITDVEREVNETRAKRQAEVWAARKRACGTAIAAAARPVIEDEELDCEGSEAGESR